jgi:hypothetical protein
MVVQPHDSSLQTPVLESPDGFNHIRSGSFRFFFFSRGKARLHVHVSHTDGEAKFWLEPSIQLAVNVGLSAPQISEATTLVTEHEEEIRHAWSSHFGH